MSTPELAIPRPKRWDSPFGEGVSPEDVARLLRVEPFRQIDPSCFPGHLPLEGILKNDARIVECQEGDLVLREGDYGNSAFLLLHGTVRVALEPLSPDLIGSPPKARKSWLRAIRQLGTSPQVPEVRAKPNEASSSLATRGEGGSARVFLQDIPRVLDENQTARLSPGEFFGELAALSRSPRTATVFAEGPAVLLEIRWQGLRDLMRRTPAIKEHIDRLYRENSLRVHLRETPLLAGLSEAALDHIAEATQFHSYGSFDWNREMASQEALSPLEKIAREPLIVEEGKTATKLLLIRSGFVRLSQRYGAGHRTLSYLGKGQVFGLEELAAEEPSVYSHSLRAVGYVDLLEIPSEVVREHLLPTLSKEDLPLRPEVRPTPVVLEESLDRFPSATESDSPLSLVDFLVDHHLMNGAEAMVIDLERCTRCDDCVRACATAHDGNPRFVREGPQYGRFQFAGACMHCADPVCMIGCPTGAIHRDKETGVVQINDPTCIGCATCANSCPYQNIRMVELRDRLGMPVLDLEQELPILKATKCDLCVEGLGGPACVRACAHDALIRLDLSDQNATAKWIDR